MSKVESPIQAPKLEPDMTNEEKTDILLRWTYENNMPLAHKYIQYAAQTNFETAMQAGFIGLAIALEDMKNEFIKRQQLMPAPKAYLVDNIFTGDI